MRKELEKLISLAGTSEFDKALSKAHDKYKDDPEAKKIITSLIKKEVQSTDRNLDRLEKEISIKLEMQQITEIVSLSYLSKTYFKKSRHWLYHRINNTIINGKPQRFKDDELNTLRFALKDISKKIGSLSI